MEHLGSVWYEREGGGKDEVRRGEGEVEEVMVCINPLHCLV